VLGTTPAVEPTPAPATQPIILVEDPWQVRGNKIVDKTGRPVRLRAMSFFWSQWMGHHWNGDVVEWMRKDWKATPLRAAMDVEMGGHLENPERERQPNCMQLSHLA